MKRAIYEGKRSQKTEDKKKEDVMSEDRRDNVDLKIFSKTEL